MKDFFFFFFVNTSIEDGHFMVYCFLFLFFFPFGTVAAFCNDFLLLYKEAH